MSDPGEYRWDDDPRTIALRAEVARLREALLGAVMAAEFFQGSALSGDPPCDCVPCQARANLLPRATEALRLCDR